MLYQLHTEIQLITFIEVPFFPPTYLQVPECYILSSKHKPYLHHFIIAVL